MTLQSLLCSLLDSYRPHQMCFLRVTVDGHSAGTWTGSRPGEIRGRSEDMLLSLTIIWSSVQLSTSQWNGSLWRGARTHLPPALTQGDLWKEISYSSWSSLGCEHFWSVLHFDQWNVLYECKLIWLAYISKQSKMGLSRGERTVRRFKHFVMMDDMTHLKHI